MTGALRNPTGSQGDALVRVVGIADHAGDGITPALVTQVSLKLKMLPRITLPSNCTQPVDGQWDSRCNDEPLDLSLR